MKVKRTLLGTRTLSLNILSILLTFAINYCYCTGTDIVRCTLYQRSRWHYRPWANINPALVQGHWTEHALDTTLAQQMNRHWSVCTVQWLSVIVEMRHPDSKKHCPVLNGCWTGCWLVVDTKNSLLLWTFYKSQLMAQKRRTKPKMYLLFYYTIHIVPYQSILI